MPVFLNSLELNAYFNLPEQLFGKSIQPSFRFFVAHIYNPFRGGIRKNLVEGPGPIIRPYHVESVQIPTYQFDKESMKYGAVPRTFPILSLDKGMNVQVTYEEDELGTIAYLINWLQKSIIDRRGYYQSPLENRIMIIVEVQDKNGIPAVYYIFHDCYYQQAYHVPL